MKRRHIGSIVSILAVATAVAGCATSASTSDAGTWTPRGSVTMVVPFGAGGGSDLAGRSAAGALEKAQPELQISVENRDGGSGTIGYSYFLGKQGKGEYLLATETALLALPLTNSLEFSYKSFTPIMKLADDFTLAVVRHDSEWQTCQDVVDAATSGRVVAGIAGATSLDNVVFKMVEHETGAKFDRVPFESGGELMTSLLGGQIEIASLNPGETAGQLKSGKLRALCAFADERYDYPELSGIPTAKEQGIDVAYAQFRGIIAPGGIPDAATDYWIDVARKAIETDEFGQYIEDNFLQPNHAAGEEFGAYLERANAELAGVLK